MRFFILSLLALSSYWGCVSPEQPYFEGTVSYAYEYQSEKLDVDSLRTIYPKTAKFFYSGPNYKSVFQAEEQEDYVYFGENGRCFSRDSILSGFVCKDYTTPPDTVYQFELRESDEIILGYKCKLLEVKAGQFTSEFYFTPEIRLNPESYRLHEAYNWKAIMEQTGGGLILKSVYHLKDFTMTGAAKEINRQTISSSEFEIPRRAIAVGCL